MIKLISNTKEVHLSLNPIEIYDKIRTMYNDSILLEIEKTIVYIAFEKISSFVVENDIVKCEYPDKTQLEKNTKTIQSIQDELKSYIDGFTFSYTGNIEEEQKLFGYCTYEAVQYFENIKLYASKTESHSIPVLNYRLYKYIIKIDLKESTNISITENRLPNDSSSLIHILSVLNCDCNLSINSFKLIGEEKSNVSDHEFLEMIEKGKANCQNGNVFQIVLSREYVQSFVGDEFQVFVNLREINPSPYMYYFDYGEYKILGASPESQIEIRDNKAFISPIAGTLPRSSNEKENKRLEQMLLNDPKESAEHIMLVDLARNDLSKNSNHIEVKKYMEIHHYSHVMHIVSEVVGEISSNINYIDLLANTFPAGTLSGAPKYKAMLLIDQIENQARGYYGGCIGYISFSNELNHAIMIRTALSINGNLHYQAGAGILSKSLNESELKEVEKKLGAIKSAISNVKI